MTTLFLDLASAENSMAATTDKSVLVSKKWPERPKEHELVPALEQMLKESRLSYPDIKRIAVVTGPGGFMSLRAGVAMANSLAHVLKIPMAGIHLSDLWFWRWRVVSGQRSAVSSNQQRKSLASAHCPLPTDHFIWLHSTKRTHLFIRGFGEYAAQWPEPVLIGLDELKDLISPRSGFRTAASDKLSTPFVGELIPEHLSALPVSKIKNLPSLESVLPEFLETLEYKPGTLTPWYGRGI